MVKYLYTAVATTGFNVESEDIIKMAFLLEEEGNPEVLAKEVFHIKPRKGRMPKDISKEALEFNGVTIEGLRKFEDPEIACGDLLGFLRRHSNEDRIIAVSHNSEFDLSFIDNFIQRYTSYNIKNFIAPTKHIDLISVAPFVEFSSDIKFNNYKFDTLCEYFNLQHRKENIVSKVVNTRRICYYFKNKIEKIN